jgi:hypothetical protein
MGHRTQITLTDDQYARLLDLSADTGRSISELIRQALDRTYSSGGLGELDASFGAWKSRKIDGEAYVDELRTGLARRLEGSNVSAR